ncbi:hypothetical protein FNU76_11360 [Chitinimonas arctica]|uniref:Uncharacterized protein n=1 Tax=Chitinimonas arctica TaxID=2594795 RepID=A0A516SFN2_9NEIS|nr:hypothetical protein [Chitinimonas arctica]QDQ26910.1 hypothetical protein FNU76_11360 [Chitinimonas arctica]
MPTKGGHSAPGIRQDAWRGTRWLSALAVLVLLAGLARWAVSANSATPPPAVTPGPPGMAEAGGFPPPPAKPAAALPAQEGEALRARLTARLARAEQLLADYRRASQYPHDSRPLAEHTDQIYPNRPVVEDGVLRSANGQANPAVRIKTSQSRVFVAAAESVVFGVSASSDDGKHLPLSVTRAVARGLAEPGQAQSTPSVAVVFGDQGKNGDAVAGDGMLAGLLIPGVAGFGQFNGTIRVELGLRVGEQEGVASFDIIYTPEVPAVWNGPVREVVEGGSLKFQLPVEVRRPGRYLVSGRVDDAKGQPFALLSYNEILGAGPQQVTLSLFGKLIRDQQPAFPLVLRDVEAYLLKEDTFPDRALLPRLTGAVHTSAQYPVSRFSAAEWQSEERSRYLTEYGKDVELAKQGLTQLGEQTRP